MASLNVKMPEPMREYVDERAEEGNFGTPTEYIRHLIREDQKAREKELLEKMLLEGLNSGESIPITEEYWEEKRKEILMRHQKNDSPCAET